MRFQEVTLFRNYTFYFLWFCNLLVCLMKNSCPRMVDNVREIEFPANFLLEKFNSEFKEV